MSNFPKWLDGLCYKDWLIDGSPSRYNAQIWDDLNWSKAWMDLGPSPAGNIGPYWHVPRISDDDIVHRLYPKLLQTKWLLLVRQVAIESKKLALRGGRG